MASRSNSYVEALVVGIDQGGTAVGESIATDENRDCGSGWGNYGQLIARLVVGDVTTTSADTFDVKFQSLVSGEWIDVPSMGFTQAAAATTETKLVIRSTTLWWGDRLRAVLDCGAGATASGVKLTLIGARS